MAVAAQIPFEKYIRLQVGMSEGEILARVGLPDREIYFDSEAQRTVESIKQYLYIPEPEAGDPHLTIITFQKGKVLNIERIKLFFSPSESKGGQIKTEDFQRLRLGMSEAEVLARVGLPDKEIFLGTDLQTPRTSIKQLLYIPKAVEHDPHVTVITIQQGRVINLERTKLLSR